MAEVETDTPLMRQYWAVKRDHADCILFFRLGDFYEMFYEDAKVASRLLELTLTSRDKGKENPTPMCGVPHHAANQYIARLVAAGLKVAVCEQVEDARGARGIVRREVVRIVTPGVVLDEDQLDARAPHYLVGLVGDGEKAGIAAFDVTTGEFSLSELAYGEIVDELGRLAPHEVLYEGIEKIDEIRMRVPAAYSTAAHAAEGTLPAVIIDRLAQLTKHELAAARIVLEYAARTLPEHRLPALRLVPYRLGDFLVIDEASRRHLEIFQTSEGKKAGSLLGTIDRSITAMGGRLLRKWIAAPLVDLAAIRRRHDAVKWLIDHASLRAEVRHLLEEIYDLERLATRVQVGVVTPKDARALALSLNRLPDVVACMARARQAESNQINFPDLIDWQSTETAASLDANRALAQTILRALVDDPPRLWNEGGFCRRGYRADLDEVLDLSDGGKEKVAAIEMRERERTGISSLKVRFNRVFGYYIEVTKTHLTRVPDDYIRKQTLANAERFVTPELAEHEEKILQAEQQRIEVELAVFEELRGLMTEAAEDIIAWAERVATLDVICAFAETAHLSDYVRPELSAQNTLRIQEGRHPVVETLLRDQRFVPNDVSIDGQEIGMILLTGPNMGGKSTAMRQTALIVLLAQAGSFVPARSAVMGLVDRIFTRVGASDNLGAGESTFMVEMRETAHILRHATQRSLVVLDEIGRGTSTYDGMAIAWAVAEYLHERIGCRTFFATHYHELTALPRYYRRVRNFSTAVEERHGEVEFLHRIVPGGASRSYGIFVARLAGVPADVVARATELAAALEAGESFAEALPRELEIRQGELPLMAASAAAPAKLSETEQALLRVDIDGLTPRAALEWMFEMRRKLTAQQGES